MFFGIAEALIAVARRILRDDRGVTAAVVAIAVPGLIGLGALGAETGIWFTISLRDQSAADAAAISAAYEVIAGKTDVINDLTPAASEAATRNGYSGLTPVVGYPYSDALVGNGVAVTLQQSRPTFLAAIFLSNVTVANKAVAVLETLNHPCVLALGTASTGVELAASTSLFMRDCSVVANSTSSTAIELDSSNSSITAATLVTAGEISVQGSPIDPAQSPSQFSLAIPAMIGAPPVADPYTSTLTHSYLTAGMPNLTQCTPKGLGGGAVIYSGACFVPGSQLKHSTIKLTGNTQISGGMTIVAQQTIDLSPGIYWISGALSIQSGGVLKCSSCDNVQGTGVTIILTMQTSTVGSMSVASGAVLNLNASKSGPFPGMLIIQDSNALPSGTKYTSLHSSIGGSATSTLNGLIYFPNSSMTFHGNPSATGPKCLLLVVSALDVDATSALDSGGCGQAGLASLPAVRTAALAE